MLLAVFVVWAEDLAHLIAHQHGQAIDEARAQFRRQGQKSADRGARARRIASIEDFADNGLPMGDESIAGLAGIAPAGLVIGNHGLRLRRHPGIGFSHRGGEFGDSSGSKRTRSSMRRGGTASTTRFASMVIRASPWRK